MYNVDGLLYIDCEEPSRVCRSSWGDFFRWLWQFCLISIIYGNCFFIWIYRGHKVVSVTNEYSSSKKCMKSYCKWALKQANINRSLLVTQRKEKTNNQEPWDAAKANNYLKQKIRRHNREREREGERPNDRQMRREGRRQSETERHMVGYYLGRRRAKGGGGSTRPLPSSSCMYSVHLPYDHTRPLPFTSSPLEPFWTCLYSEDNTGRRETGRPNKQGDMSAEKQTVYTETYTKHTYIMQFDRKIGAEADGDRCKEIKKQKRQEISKETVGERNKQTEIYK